MLKRILPLILVLGWSLPSHAKVLNCWAEADPDSSDKNNSDLFFVEDVKGTCEEGFSFRISGYGVGFGVSAESIVISCTADDPRGGYGGMKLSFGAIVGGTVPIVSSFVGSNGICTVAGGGWSLRAGFNFDSLDIN